MFPKNINILVKLVHDKEMLIEETVDSKVFDIVKIIQRHEKVEEAEGIKPLLQALKKLGIYIF